MRGEAARPSRRALWIGAGLFWAVQLGLRFGLDLALLDSVLVAALAVAVPALAIWQVPLVDDVEIEPIPAYWGSIVTLWLLGGATWLVGAREGGAAALGIRPIAPGPLAGWTVGLVAAAFAIILVFREIANRSGTPDTPLLRTLLPRTPRERGVFAVLSCAAGVSEELAYRGYFIGVCAPAIGTAGAVVASSVAFGVVHAYQGALGMVRTGLMGAVLAGGFLASGSLLPAILAHVLVDLLGGIVFGERLLSHERANGVEADPELREPADETPPWK